uniref:Uncharacterized protein n=1 Tax=Zonotrichia albicollis TaxID=44394 RepID=A0A8D2N0V8_ZONAL
MGCGGSRADAIEPRYYESWTRETESTWLTNTDSESPPQEGGSGSHHGLHANHGEKVEFTKSTQKLSSILEHACTTCYAMLG